MRLIYALPAAFVVMLAASDPSLARCDRPFPVRVGPVTGNPKKDTVGLFCATPDASTPGPTANTSRDRPVQVGATVGDGEKDTIGYVAQPERAPHQASSR